MSVTIHHYKNFFLLLRTFKIYSFSNFQICNIVLVVVTICTWHLHDLVVLYLASVQFSLSVVSNCLWLHGLQHAQASLSITNSQSFLKLMSIELVMPSNHLIFSCPLLLLPSIFPRSRVFSNESVLHIRWSKYWSFNFSISPSKEYSGLISFTINRFYLLAVQGTPKCLL